MEDEREKLVGEKIVKRVGDRLDGEMKVEIDEERELISERKMKMVNNMIKRKERKGLEWKGIVERKKMKILRDLKGIGLIGKEWEKVERMRSEMKEEDLKRNWRKRLIKMIEKVIEEGEKEKKLNERKKNIEGMKSEIMDEKGGKRKKKEIEMGLDEKKLRGKVRIGIKIENLGMKKKGIEKIVKIDIVIGRKLEVEKLKENRLKEELVMKKWGEKIMRVGRRIVDIVDRKDDRKKGWIGVIDGLNSMRNEDVIRRKKKNGNIGWMWEKGKNWSKGGVERSIDEGDIMEVM